jgi:hypothetical protein
LQIHGVVTIFVQFEDTIFEKYSADLVINDVAVLEKKGSG